MPVLTGETLLRKIQHLLIFSTQPVFALKTLVTERSQRRHIGCESILKWICAMDQELPDGCPTHVRVMLFHVSEKHERNKR